VSAKEYDDGAAVAMAPTSQRHDILELNISYKSQTRVCKDNQEN